MNVAPSGHRVACVDFDGTLAPWGPLMEVGAPFPGAKEAIGKLKAHGYRIVILTSRLSPRWWADEAHARGVNARIFGEEQTSYVKAYLRTYLIPFDEVTAEKVPAEVYFDDRAIGVSEAFSLWDAVADFMERQA